MTNTLVGDVYQKIIDDVITASRQEFEETGVNPSTLLDMEKEWKAKLTARDVAHMPWQPKPEPPPPVRQSPNPTASLPSAATNGLPPAYTGYNQQPGMPNGNSRIKTEPVAEPQYHGLPNGYGQNPLVAEGGQARAQHLTQQYAQARGLALPGQRAQGMQQPAPSQQQAQQQAQQMYMQQQRQQAAQQQAALHQQQAQPRIKVENDSPQLNQGGFQQQQRHPNPAYAQTDGADEGLQEWQAMMVERRAATTANMQRADRLMRDHITQMSSELESGLMVPLDEQPGRAQSKKRRVAAAGTGSSALAGPSVPQLDGDLDEDEKPIKEEEDEDAINSDLDSDNDPTAELDDDDEEFGDAILCTYDKVQRVKNKWKCTLKDGVMSINGKEWVFHKGTGEFEW